MLKILVIEDEIVFVNLWKISLDDCINKDQLAIVQCVNVEQAVEAIRRYRPQVLFLDHHLSRLYLNDGFKIVEAVRPEFPDMRIISTSSEFGLPYNEAFNQSYEALGVREWVSKRALAEKVRDVLG